MPSAQLVWKKTRDPLAETEPAFHHPERCMNCGHLREDHVEEVGCLVDGGTKYIEDSEGNGRRACSCIRFSPAPVKENTNAK